MKRFIAAVCAAAMLASIAGCGGQSQQSQAQQNQEQPAAGEQAQANNAETTEQSNDLIKIEVFNQYSNYQGTQIGWFGQVLKDKFNIEANIISPNVSGGGDTLYQTRSAAGNLGDIILLDNANSKIQDSLRVGLFLDMKENGLLDKYGSNIMEYAGAIERAQKLYDTGDSVYIVPMQVSNLSPMEPQDGKYLNNGVFVRWDYYTELGAPQVKDFDGVLDLLKQMQEAHPTSESGKTTYGVSLFKDWDGILMNAPSNMNYMNGEEIIGSFGVIDYKNNYAITDLLDRNAQYMKGLEFFNKAERMGLLDPDSPSQNFDTLKAKVEDGQVLFCFWPWLGENFDKKNGNQEAGRGFRPLSIDSQKLIATGSTPNGQFRSIQIGSKTQYPERMMELVDWLYSPEYTQISNVGIKGLMWDIVDGEPVKTDFLDAMGNDTVMPAEYGGGTYIDGVSYFSNMFVAGTSIDPTTGEPYNADLWQSTLLNKQTQLDKDWEAIMGVQTQKEYVMAHDQIAVVPGTDFTEPTPSSDLQNKINQISAIIKDTSWRLVYAKDDADFDRMYDAMLSDVKAMGYDEVYEYYKGVCEEKIAMMKEVVEQYK